MVTQYSRELIDHYKNPRNMGEMERPDVSATVGNTTCGDVMTMFLKVKNDLISDISFQTYGCGPCVALSSMVTEKAKGMNIDDAYEITIGEFTNKYPEIPRNKLHCTNLVIIALHKAIDMYREKQREREV